jgi:hypothetical protein
MITFTSGGPALSSADVTNAERKLGITFPAALRRAYLSSNGGSPYPYVFENDDLDTVVTEFLPLSGRTGTAIQTWTRLIREQGLLPERYFPFAVDGGGDYFFVDCASPEGAVYIYRSDTSLDDRLLDLRMELDDFWASLKEE